MSSTLAQIFALNPATTVNATDYFYLVQSPYSTGTDAAITGANLKTALSSNASGTANQLAWYAASGTTLSGLATANSGTLVTSATGVPSISQTLPTAVTSNIATLGTITSGIWNGTAIGPTFGGTGQSTYVLGDILYASAANTLSRLSGSTVASKRFLAQVGTGTVSAAPAWVTIASTDLPSAAMTAVSDTNVTLVLGGTPASSLLQATSLTMGWTGTLGVARGGTAASSFNANGVVISGTTTTSALTSLALTDGQIVIGSSTGAPLAASITAGTGITVTPGHNTITIAASAGTGTVTSIATTGLITGGTITTTGTLNVTAAAISDQQTGTSSTVAVTPSVQKYSLSAIKTWINFYGPTPTINDSSNVSSLVRNSTGNYTVSFTTSFANTFYACSGMHGSNGANSSSSNIGTLATGSASIITMNGSSGFVDPGTVMMLMAGRF